MELLRSIGVVIVACVAVASVGSPGGAAAATVTNGRLDLRGLQRTSGHQMAAVHGIVTPPPARRTVIAATLTVGGTSLPIEVIVTRTGRLTARASRLALAGVLPDFGSARLDLPSPIDASVEFAAADCVARSHGRILACPASDGVPERAPDGVYDTEVELDVGSNHQSISPALASLTTNPNGSRGIAILLSMYDSLSLTGTPDGATSVLTGYSVTGGDILANASGSATSSHGPAGSRVDGSATSAPFGTAFTWPFTLRRPDAGTPGAAGGTWVVSFDGTLMIAFVGDARLDVTVAADGHATTAPTALVSGGSPIYGLDAGTCLIAPAGAIRCLLPSPQLYGVVMHGALDFAAGTGHGGFYVGAPPSISAQGAWTATRMP